MSRINAARRRPGHILAVALAGIVSLSAASCSAEPSPEEGAAQRLPAPGEPYPFDRPAPPRVPTDVDGRYSRNVSVAGAGGESLSCRRCAPYRLDAGRMTLTLDRGRFFVAFFPMSGEKRCPDCTRVPGFEASGHFEVSSDQILIYNDANCTHETGTYSWSQDGDAIVLDEIEDECFMGLRARFFSFAPWTLK